MAELKKSKRNECNHNRQMEKLNFLKWYEFVEIEMASGRRQSQCVICRKWYFTSEL